MRTHPELNLLSHFQDLADARVNRTKEHRHLDLLVIAVGPLLCGGEGFNDMEDFGEAKEDWLKTLLGLPNGIPRHDPFKRVFQALDPQSFLECFQRWTQSLRVAVSEEIVALDGKALRRALQAGGPAPVLVSAWAREHRLVLGQLKVAWLAEREKWEGLRSVGVVEAVRQAGKDPATVERRYYLSSLTRDAARFARAVRGHWSVENQCHWRLDVNWGEDQRRARAGPRGGKARHLTASGAESVAACEDQEARDQRQTEECRLGSQLLAQTFGRLDASALGCRGTVGWKTPPRLR